MFQKLSNWWLKLKLRKYFDNLPDGALRTSKGTVKQIVQDPKFFSASPVALATALTELVDEGFIEQRYQVVREDGSYMPEIFPDPRDIPDRIYDPVIHGMRDTGSMDVGIVFLTR